MRFASFHSGGFTTMVCNNKSTGKETAKIILYALVPWVPYIDIIKELGLSTHVFYATEVCKKNKGRHGTFASISPNYFSYLQVVNAVWD